MICQRRPAARANQTLKDIQQVEQIIEVLLEDRPAVIYAVITGAMEMPPKFMQQIKSSMTKLSKTVGDELHALLLFGKQM